MGERTRVTSGVALAVAVLLVLTACDHGWLHGRGRCRSRHAHCTWTTEITGERKVSLLYRQGLARVQDGWILTFNNAIFRTDDDLNERVVKGGAIPAELTAQGYDHIGDPDVYRGHLWVPLEQPAYANGVQRTARYDLDTLEYVDSVEVPQHHNAFVAVDRGILYSADEFSDDTLLRYLVVGNRLVPLRPLVMSKRIERIQGADIWDGAAWLSTDDATNGLYRVDLHTGTVTDVGSMGHLGGEGEGIDATPLPSGQLHALVGDDTTLDMWLVDLRVDVEKHR